MREDDRSFPYQISAQLITDPLVQIGFDKDNRPKYVFYKVPGFKIIKTTNIIWDDYDEYYKYYNTSKENAAAYAGKMVLTKASINLSPIYIDGEEKFAGTIEEITFPKVEEYTPGLIDKVVNYKVTVTGFTANGRPIWGDFYKGKTTTTRSIEFEDSYIIPDRGGGQNSITRTTFSNYRIINDKLFFDVERVEEDMSD